MSDLSDGPLLRIDKGTGRPVLVSPGRLKRPRNTGPERDGEFDCPFCSGSEGQTPPEEEAIRTDGSAPDTPGWTARAFKNLFPATHNHEVIAEGDDHTTHASELSADILRDSVALYRRRIAAFELRDDVRCAFLFKNVGAAAGASIAHNHSQLLGLPMIPPRLVSELSACRDGCIHCEEIESAQAEGRIVHRSDHHVVLAPSTPKLPFETWMLPLAHDDDFLESKHDDDLVRSLAALFAGATSSFKGGAFNLCLHRISDEDFHWHFELQPRIGNVAALEIGADMYINAITAQMSAARWRDAIG